MRPGSPTTIQDEYEVVLNTVYETHVPAAVVVAEPKAINLPEMQPGDVYNGEITFTNYGLIRAKDVNFALPGSDGYFRYELLADVPETIEAGQSVTVPYRVVSLAVPDGGDGGAGASTCSGSSCSNPPPNGNAGCRWLWYRYKCANGQVFEGTEYVCFYGSWIVPTTPPNPGNPSGNPGGSTSVVVAAASGGGGSLAPAYQTLQGVTCGPKWYCEVWDTCCKEAARRAIRSAVDLLRGEYTDDVSDLRVRVPGFSLNVTRRYYDEAWHFDHENQNLDLVYGVNPLVPDSIYKDGALYEKLDTAGTTYGYGDDRRIYIEDPGYRWEDAKGGWADYDAEGRLAAYGNANGVRVSVLYDPDTGKLTGLVDNDGQQALVYVYASTGELASAHDAAGRTVTYEYTDGKLTRVVGVLGEETLYVYDTEGRLEHKDEPGGRTTTLTYDGQGRIRTATYEDGSVTGFDYDYDASRKEYYARVTSPGGKVEETWYDRFGKKTRTDVNGRTVERIVTDGRSKITIDAAGNETYEEFDEWGNRTKRIYPDGATITYEYQPGTENLVRTTDERGVVTTYDYDANGNRTRMTEAVGTLVERATEYTHDAQGRVLSERRLGDAVTPEALTTWAYDDPNHKTTITDPEGNVTTLTYDDLDHVIEKVDARGNRWAYTYDDAGNLVTEADPLGNTRTYAYDARGNRIRETDPLGSTTTYTYDTQDRLLLTTDPLGAVTTFVYDADGHRTEQIDPEGKSTRFVYDTEGQLVETLDGAGNEVAMEYGAGSGAFDSLPSRVVYPTYSRRYSYDVRGRVTEETAVLGPDDTLTTASAYDPGGNLISVTDPEGRTTYYAYDGLGRRVGVTDAMGYVTESQYDNRDNLIALTDANGNTTQFEYDRSNRVVKEIRPLGHETTYAYDPVGNRVEKTDAKGQITRWEYDAAGRMIATRYYAAADPVNPVKTITFIYDAAGRLTGYDDGTTSATYTYDALGRKLTETVDYGPFTKAHAYTYTANGREKTFTGPDGVTYTYEYDEAGNLLSILIPGEGPITYGDYRSGRPGRITYPGGVTRELTYDPLSRIQRILAKDPVGSPLMDYRYTYAPAGNITEKATEHGTYTYGYDELYRLTSADNPTLPDEAFTYDAVGNRLTSANVAGEWLYNQKNELQGYGDVSFLYDADGNTVRKTQGSDVTVYVYDIGDRLVRVEDGSGGVIAKYGYDPFGRRLWKEVGGMRRYFVYAEEGLVGEFDTAGADFKSYGYLSDATWTSDPLYLKTGGQYYWYRNDHLGTPKQLVDATGAIVWESQAQVYGGGVASGSLINSNLMFPGQYYDEETELHYNFRRYYDAETGRYLTSDPIGLTGGINRFTYAMQNPVIYYDQNGEKTKWKVFFAIQLHWGGVHTQFVPGPGTNQDRFGWVAL